MDKKKIFINYYSNCNKFSKLLLQECILPFVKLIIIELFEYFYCIKYNSKCILNNNFARKFLNICNLLLIKTFV